MKLYSLPTKVKECVLKQQTYLHQPQQVNEFGQNRLQLTIEDEEGKKRKINCGTNASTKVKTIGPQVTWLR